MRGFRILDAIYSVALVVILVGGALLYAEAHRTAVTNSKFICAFGAAISAEPLKPEGGESIKEFRSEVRQTRQFVKALEDELEDCDAPTVVVIDPEAKEDLRDSRPGRQQRDGDRRGGDLGNPSPQSQGNGLDGGPGAPPDLPPIDPPAPSPDVVDQILDNGQNAVEDVQDVVDDTTTPLCQQVSEACELLP